MGINNVLFKLIELTKKIEDTEKDYLEQKCSYSVVETYIDELIMYLDFLDFDMLRIIELVCQIGRNGANYKDFNRVVTLCIQPMTKDQIVNYLLTQADLAKSLTNGAKILGFEIVL